MLMKMGSLQTDYEYLFEKNFTDIIEKNLKMNRENYEDYNDTDSDISEEIGI